MKETHLDDARFYETRLRDSGRRGVILYTGSVKAKYGVAFMVTPEVSTKVAAIKHE